MSAPFMVTGVTGVTNEGGSGWDVRNAKEIFWNVTFLEREILSILGELKKGRSAREGKI